MNRPKLRRAKRIPVNLTIEVIESRRATTYNTVDVSRVGVFIHTHAPRKARQLVRLRIQIGNGPALELHGMVVRAITLDDAEREGREPGMGIEFYGFSGEPQRRWEAYLTALSAAHGRLSDGRRPATWPPRFNAARTADTRHVSDEVVLLLPVADIDHLWEICNWDIPAGRTFLPLPYRLPDGLDVVIRVVHPLSQEAYDLHGNVRHMGDDPQLLGLAVILRPGVQTRQEQFKTFIERGMPRVVELLDS